MLKTNSNCITINGYLKWECEESERDKVQNNINERDKLQNILTEGDKEQNIINE